MSERRESKLTSRFARNWARLTGPSRIAGVDLARGLAVIGMFAAHLLWIPDFEWADAATWTDVVNGRSSILFATLAGVSMGLVTGRTRPYTGPMLHRARVQLAVRAGLVWLIGFLLVLLEVPVYVILPAYGVLFLVALPLLRLPASWLFALAAALGLTMPAVWFFVERLPFWDTEAGWLVETALGLHYPFPVWAAFIAAGLGVARLRFDRPAVAAVLLAVGAVLAAIGYGVSAAMLPVREGDPVSFVAWWTDAGAHSSGAGEVVGSGGFALAVIGLCMLVCATPARWVLVPLRAVGAMALTAYAGQLVAWALLQPPSNGMGELAAFRALDPFWPFTIVTIVACTAWVLLVGRGPLEWVVTRVSRGDVARLVG